MKRTVLSCDTEKNTVLPKEYKVGGRISSAQCKSRTTLNVSLSTLKVLLGMMPDMFNRIEEMIVDGKSYRLGSETTQTHIPGLEIGKGRIRVTDTSYKVTLCLEY